MSDCQSDYRERVQAAKAKFAKAVDTFDGYEGDHIGGDFWGAPEALAELCVERGQNEGAYLAFLPRVVEVAQGRLVLNSVDKAAGYAWGLIKTGAVDYENRRENCHIDGYSYARGNLPRFISGAEADAQFDREHPTYVEALAGIEAPTQDQIASAVTRSVIAGDDEGFPEYALTQAGEDEFHQVFAVELFIGRQSNAYYFKFVPHSCLDKAGEWRRVIWSYHARAITLEQFEANQAGDIHSESTSDQGYCGSATPGPAYTVKEGFYFAREFQRAFDSLFYAMEA